MTTAWRIFWLFVLGFHATSALGWWWLAPGGFASWHPRFWTNCVAPPLVLGVVATTFWASRRERPEILRAIIAGFPAGWFAAAVAARSIFPITLAWLFLAPLVGGLVMALGVVLAFRGDHGRSRKALACSLISGAMLGSAIPAGFRPLPPETRPRCDATVTALGEVATFPGAVGVRTFVSLGDGSATIRLAPLRVTVQPLLRFLARSPDGAPTILSPATVREGRGLRLVGSRAIPNGVDLRYRTEYDASLRVEEVEGAILMDATASLPSTIWSHLNGFCDVDVSGHRRLSLAFSPCPGVRIEVRPMDYPFGRPLRFAFLEASGRFRVVEATSGEKGPYRELASGPLARGDALAIQLFDDDRAVARIVLEDWSAQVDVQPSPTAGWGAPANAIEFSLAGDEPTSSASIYITLSSTSVGRGWDCVGHRAGVYRNRVRVEPVHDGS